MSLKLLFSWLEPSSDWFRRRLLSSNKQRPLSLIKTNVLRNSQLTIDENSLPRSVTAKRKSALQFNSSNTNNSTSAEPIPKHWRKNYYNTCQSMQYNQRVLRPRSAPKLTLSEITLLESSLKTSLSSLYTRSNERIYIQMSYICDRASERI